MYLYIFLKPGEYHILEIYYLEYMSWISLFLFPSTFLSGTMPYWGRQTAEVPQESLILWGSIGTGPVQGRLYAEASFP